jgi:triosephosphate isomerase
MVARKPVVGGNWKMNLDLASAVELAEDIVAGCADGALTDACDVVLYPPFPYLQAVGRALGHHDIALGAQDVHPAESGAFTGEVSTSMLADLHVKSVIVGHSERRHLIGEDDELVNEKVLAALAAELDVTLCVGERLEEREAGGTSDVVLRQLERGLDGVDDDAIRRVVIAYEPVWAIGTGLHAEPADAAAVHDLIRRSLRERYDGGLAERTRIQYGGSVNPSNAAGLVVAPGIDGFLVGGASLRPDDFLAIIRTVANHARRLQRETRETSA